MKLNVIIAVSFVIIFFVKCNNLIAQNCNLNISFTMDYNSLTYNCAFEDDSARLSIEINSVTGGSGNYTITNDGDGFVSENQITSGGSFIYGWSENDSNFIPQLSTLNFTIDDGAGNVCNISDIDPFLNSVLNFVSFSSFCQQGNLLDDCTNTLIHYENYAVSDSVYSTRHNIISRSNLPNNGNITYQGGNFVRLDNNFNVPISTNFTAEINSCDP